MCREDKHFNVYLDSGKCQIKPHLKMDPSFSCSHQRQAFVMLF